MRGAERSSHRPAARRSPGRLAARLIGMVAVPGLCVLGPAPAAGAHVTVTPSTTAAGEHAVLDISLSHGCDGSATTEVTIRIPEGINAVAPTRHPLWEVEKETVQLDPPVTDSHGGSVSERVASVTYRTDTPLPDGQRDVFQLAVQLPEQEGASLVFPTIQTCEEGGSAWLEVPADGQDPHALERPAPAFVVTAAQAHGHGHDASFDAGSDAGSTGAAAASTSRTGAPEVEAQGRSTALSVGALALGAVGAVLGGSALVLQRRRA